MGTAGWGRPILRLLLSCEKEWKCQWLGQLSPGHFGQELGCQLGHPGLIICLNQPGHQTLWGNWGGQVVEAVRYWDFPGRVVLYQVRLTRQPLGWGGHPCVYEQDPCYWYTQLTESPSSNPQPCSCYLAAQPGLLPGGSYLLGIMSASMHHHGLMELAGSAFCQAARQCH